MEDKLNEIITEHEENILKYTQERNSRNEKIRFMIEHKFDHERDFLQSQKDAISDMFYDYQKVIEDLREMLNAWLS